MANITAPRGTYDLEKTYPPRDGYTVTLKRNGTEAWHVGYMKHGVKKCMCGADPVFEQYAGDDDASGHRRIPATEFVAICPKCELRMEGQGSLEFCEEQWNAGHFSEASLLVHERLDVDALDEQAWIAMAGKIINDMSDEAVDLIIRKHELQKQLDDPLCNDNRREILYTTYKKYRADLIKMTNFFRYSPLMMNRDGDAVMSDIRKRVYPELKPEERIRIPLRLESM